MKRYAAAILAAGRASRYRASGGQDATKLVADLRGAPLVRHAALAALASVARPVRAVTGHAAAEVADALAGLDLTIVHNPDYAEGLSTSLRTAVSNMPSTVAGIVVMLGDMPDVAKEVIDALIEAAASTPSADAVVPVQGGRRGNPVLLARSLFPAVAALAGDRGARDLLRQDDVNVLEVTWSGSATQADVDDVATLEAARLSKGRVSSLPEDGGLP